MKLKIYIHVITLVLIFTVSSAESFQATFTPRISVSEEYTNNYSQADQNNEDEFITLISLGFTAGLLGKTRGLEISYDPSFAYYNEFDENNTGRHHANFSGFTEITKNTRLDISDTFSWTEDPTPEENIAVLRTEQPEAQIDTTIRRGRNSYATNSAGLNFTYRFGESSSINMGYAHRFLENDDPTIADTQAHNPSIGFTYFFTPRWGLNAGGAYTRNEYEIADDIEAWSGSGRLTRQFSRHFYGYVGYAHTVTKYDGETQDDLIYNPSIGINYSVAEDISLSFDIGYFVNEYELREDESGLTGNAGLIKRFRRGSVNLSGLGGYEYANFGAERLGFSLFYEAAVSVNYQITRYFSGNIFGSFRNNQYKDITPEREDDSIMTGLGLTIQPLQWMSIGINYNYRQLDSTIDQSDYASNRVSVRVTLSPSQPFRTSRY
ncbi:outer membrane beta-barrel protein [Thermodesulfobacteriota bacterium]